MHLTTQTSDDTLIVALHGHLDATTAPTLEAQLPTQGVRELVLDFAQCPFVSSAGLRVFLAALRQLGGGKFRLLSPTEAVREVLDISGFANIMAISDSLEG